MSGYLISEHFAQRLKSTVLQVEAMSPSLGSGKIRATHEEQLRASNFHRLCKTTAAFSKGTTATLDIWEDGTPPTESQSSGETVEGVVNKYADIASGKWVSVARHGNGYWYVVAAECG